MVYPQGEESRRKESILFQSNPRLNQSYDISKISQGPCDTVSCSLATATQLGASLGVGNASVNGKRGLCPGTDEIKVFGNLSQGAGRILKIMFGNCRNLLIDLDGWKHNVLYL